MKMVCVLKVDFDVVIDVLNVIEQFEKGWMLYDDDFDKFEWFDCDDVKQCQCVFVVIFDVVLMGSLFCVMFGMIVVFDLCNELFDLVVDMFELYLKFVVVCDCVLLVLVVEVMDVQWWFVEFDQYGNLKLLDGVYLECVGVDKVMYLIKSFGFDNKGKCWVVV